MSLSIYMGNSYFYHNDAIIRQADNMLWFYLRNWNCVLNWVPDCIQAAVNITIFRDRAGSVAKIEHAVDLRQNR